jgi:hypothetical protein
MNEIISSASITTDCLCSAVDDDGEGLLDENGEAIPADNCREGECWEWQADDLDSYLQDWLADNDSDKETEVFISCDSQRWTRTGFKALVKAEKILSALSLNGDFRLEFRIDKFGVLDVTRYSHDENTGTAPFIIRIATDEDRELFE